MDKNNTNSALANFGINVQLTPASAIYIFLAIALGSVAFFVAKKYIR